MTWNDDSWKDSYDAWKLRSPDDEHQEHCYHEGFDIGMDGLAHCDCGKTWIAAQDEIADFRERNKLYDAWCRRQAFRERWFGWWDRLRDRIRVRIWLYRHGMRPNIDDDIPF